MSYRQSRSISFQTIASFFKSTKPTPSTELQKPLTSLPNATGGGAFAEPITYQVLGASSNLLNIKLPKSSILNIRYSNSQQKIIAMNGHISSMYTELAKSTTNNLIFQRCFNQTEPMSLLISMNAENSNFAVIANKLKSKWIIKKSSLFAWSGSTIKPSSSDESSKLIQMAGEGAFVIATPGQLMQLDLAENESLQVNSKAIVGYTTTTANITEAIVELNSGIKSVVDVSIPKAPLSLRLNWMKRFIYIPASILENTTVKQFKQTTSTVTEFIKSTVNYVKAKLLSSKKTGYFVEVKGPRTVFLSNAINIDDKILTENEMKKLLN